MKKRSGRKPQSGRARMPTSALPVRATQKANALANGAIANAAYGHP